MADQEHEHDQNDQNDRSAQSARPETLLENGLSAYVDAHDDRSDRLVVLCRACAISSPPLAVGDETGWFKRHVAEEREEHHRWRSRQGARQRVTAGGGQTNTTR